MRTELLTEIDFIRAFTQVFNYYKKQGKKIKYILHRRENRKILEQHFSNIEIVQFDNLLELELLIKKIKPLHIASFYSAALFSLKKIYDITLIDSFLLDIEHIDDIHRQAVQACYDFNKEHMNIIDLGDI